MAKIVINVDTEADTLDVSVDGKSLDNVKDISIGLRPSYYSYGPSQNGNGNGNDDELYVNICMHEEDEESGLKTFTSLTAKNSIEGQKILNNGQGEVSRKFPGLIKSVQSNSVERDIAKYLGYEE